MFFNSVKQLLITSRPIGWLLFSGTFLAGYFYSGGRLNLLIFLNFLIFTFPACLLVFGLNDIADSHKDAKNPRKSRAITGGILDPIYFNLIWVGCFISGILLLVFPIILLKIEMLLWVCLLIFLSWSYSFSPIRFKSRPFFELFTNVVGTWSVVIVGYTYNKSSLDFFNQLGIFNFIALTSLILGIALLSYLADFEADKQTGETNSVQFFGQKKSIVFSLICFVVSAVLIRYQFLAIGLVAPVILILTVIIPKKIFQLSTLYQFTLIYLIILFSAFIFIYGIK